MITEVVIVRITTYLGLSPYLVGETGKHSYFDTWGDGFEIMYHVSTMLPFNTLDPQQIQRKRHIGNDIVCIVFVDGDQPFVPNTIKSQFLHIFVIVHPITLPDGTRGYSATIACDEQVPEFGPPLPDPPIFRNPVELRAFLLCKMINGENAAYKAPRLIKPHQRARSGLLENLVAKANTLAKDSSKKQKAVSQVSTSVATSTAGYSLPMVPNSTISSSVTASPSVASNGACYCNQSCQHYCQHQCHYHHHPSQSLPRLSLDKDGYPVCYSTKSKVTPSTVMGECGSSFPSTTTSTSNSGHTGLQHGVLSSRKVSTLTGMKTGTRSPFVHLGSETAASLFKTRRRSSNADSSKIDASLLTGKDKDKDKDRQGNPASAENHSQLHASPLLLQQAVDPCSTPSQPSPMLLPSPGHLPVSECNLENDLSFKSLSSGAAQEHGCCSTTCCCCCSQTNSCQTASASCCPTNYNQEECSPGTSTTAPQADQVMSSGSYHHSVGGVGGVGTGGLPLQRAPSTPTSPTEFHFAINRHGGGAYDGPFHLPTVSHEAPEVHSPGMTISKFTYISGPKLLEAKHLRFLLIMQVTIRADQSQSSIFLHRFKRAPRQQQPSVRLCLSYPSHLGYPSLGTPQPDRLHHRCTVFSSPRFILTTTTTISTTTTIITTIVDTAPSFHQGPQVLL